MKQTRLPGDKKAKLRTLGWNPDGEPKSPAGRVPLLVVSSDCEHLLVDIEDWL